MQSEKSRTGYFALSFVEKIYQDMLQTPGNSTQGPVLPQDHSEDHQQLQFLSNNPVIPMQQSSIKFEPMEQSQPSDSFSRVRFISKWGILGFVKLNLGCKKM